MDNNIRPSVSNEDSLFKTSTRTDTPSNETQSRIDSFSVETINKAALNIYQGWYTGMDKWKGLEDVFIKPLDRSPASDQNSQLYLKTKNFKYSHINELVSELPLHHFENESYKHTLKAAKYQNKDFGKFMAQGIAVAHKGCEKYNWSEEDRLFFLSLWRSLIEMKVNGNEHPQHARFRLSRESCITKAVGDYSPLVDFWTKNKHKLKPSSGVGDLPVHTKEQYTFDIEVDGRATECSMFLFFEKLALKSACIKNFFTHKGRLEETDGLLIRHTSLLTTEKMVLRSIEIAQKFKTMHTLDQPNLNEDEVLGSTTPQVLEKRMMPHNEEIENSKKCVQKQVALLGELFWIVCQAKPWHRGDPSIAEMWFKSLALEQLDFSSWKEGIVPWVEVMKFTNAKEFGQHFHTLFEEDPCLQNRAKVL